MCAKAARHKKECHLPLFAKSPRFMNLGDAVDVNAGRRFSRV